MHLFKKLLCTSLVLLPLLSSAQADSTVIPLWKNGAPGFEKLRNVPEKGPQYISNVNNPSITVFLPPKEKATGAAVLVCPGGGHRILVMKSEGYDPAHYLNSLGIAAIVLKYRLARDTNSPYKLVTHAKQDANRAMRIIRNNASQWGIDTNRIGIMGFSAGGEVVNWVLFDQSKEQLNAKDPIDQLNAMPNFAIEVYPGPLGVPEKVPAAAPPIFMIAANDDECCSLPIITLLQKYREAKVPAELHIYAKGNHAFNMGYRSKIQELKNWPGRLTDWFADNNYFRQVPVK